MNRFEICAAYHLVATRWHTGQSSRGYAVLSRLARLGYTPGRAVTRRGSDERAAAARLLWARRREIRRSW